MNRSAQAIIDEEVRRGSLRPASDGVYRIIRRDRIDIDEGRTIQRHRRGRRRAEEAAAKAALDARETA